MSKLIVALMGVLLAVPVLAKGPSSIVDLANPPEWEQNDAQNAAKKGATNQDATNQSAADQSAANQSAANPGTANQGTANPGTATNQAPTDQTPADVDMANVRSAGQAASAPAAATPAQGSSPQAQPAVQDREQEATQVLEPKSSIPLSERRGPDITKCLEAGDKSDRAINACADKYRPR